MSATSHSRLVNPLLGTYFGIFTSLLAAIVLILMVLEQLGLADETLRVSMIAGFLGLYCAIGVATFTRVPAEYFASGRRVPAFFNGLTMALVALGGTGLAGIGGSLFLIGFDALCIGVGLAGGLVCTVALVAPYLRKFGAYTIPGYLSRRFDSHSLRVVAAALVSVPCLLLLTAELKLAVFAASWLTQLSEELVMLVLVGVLILIVAPGGMRSLTWASAAAAIAAIAALMVPVVIVAVMTTNLPFPQMSYGPILRGLMRTEVAQAVPASAAAMLAFDLPGSGSQPILSRFATPFSSVGPMAFVLAGLAIMLGTAGSAPLLSRAGTASGVYEARKSLGWAAFVLGVLLMTLSAVAVFMRDTTIGQLAGAERPADWFVSLVNLGLAEFGAQATPGTLSSYTFSRDALLIALPASNGFPAVLVYLAAAGLVSAALVGASAAVAALASMLGEDVISGPRSEFASDGARVMGARAGVVLAGAAAGWMAVATPGDPLELFLWSLALSGSAVFPPIVMSIWWKRTNAWGALAGLVAGFAVAASAIMTGSVASIGLPAALVAVVGAPASFLAIIVVSILTRGPERHVLEMIRDLRIPGGETLYDREARLALLQRRQKG